MNRHITMILLSLLGLLFTAAALTRSASAQGGPCAEDAKKFCQDQKPGGGRLSICLTQHQSELSEGCKNYLQKAQQTAQSQRAAILAQLQACKSDTEKYCTGVSPGDRRLLKCLREHKAELSSECQAQLGTKAAPKN